MLPQPSSIHLLLLWIQISQRPTTVSAFEIYENYVSLLLHLLKLSNQLYTGSQRCTGENLYIDGQPHQWTSIKRQGTRPCWTKTRRTSSSSYWHVKPGLPLSACSPSSSVFLFSPRCPAPACAGAPGSAGSGCGGFPRPAAGSHGAHKPAWRPDSGPPATERSSPRRRGLQLADVPLRCRPPAEPEPHRPAASPPAADRRPCGAGRRRFVPAWVTDDSGTNIISQFINGKVV